MQRRRLIFATALIGVAGFTGTARAQGSGPLLQPGEPYPGSTQEPVHLHMPVHHESTPTSDSTTKSANSIDNAGAENESAPQVDLIHPHRRKHAASTQVAKTAAPSGSVVTVPFSLDGTNTTPAASPVAGAKASPRAPAQATSSNPDRQASAASAGADHGNLTKRGAILFEKGAPAPSPAQYKGVKVLADDLNSQLEKGASAIQLEAYGGTPGDKSSDARRLALRRALAVRQLLIDDGVPSARIDVRAMGGADDKGPADRVDVFIRAG